MFSQLVKELCQLLSGEYISLQLYIKSLVNVYQIYLLFLWECFMKAVLFKLSIYCIYFQHLIKDIDIKVIDNFKRNYFDFG